MSGRTYLSIGDVLALLRQEFPDVTISKIRFLESQGLVNPERTPSGYRKFYEHDVERLRWVLRQQREHFLPLKVIKGRLEQEVADYGDDNGHDGARGRDAGTPEPALVGRRRRPGRPPGRGARAPGVRGPGQPRPSRRRPDRRQGGPGSRCRPPPGAGPTRPDPGAVRPAEPAPVGSRRAAGGAVPARRTGPARPGAGGRGASSRAGARRRAGPGGLRRAPRRPRRVGLRAGAAAEPTEPTKVSGGAAMGSTDLGSRHPGRPMHRAVADGDGAS